MYTTKIVAWGVGVIAILMVSIVLFAGIMTSIGVVSILLRSMFFFSIFFFPIAFAWGLYKALNLPDRNQKN